MIVLVYLQHPVTAENTRRFRAVAATMIYQIKIRPFSVIDENGDLKTQISFSQDNSFKVELWLQNNNLS